MEANKTLVDNPTVRNIALWAFIVFASVFMFVFLACYIKALTGGPWAVPIMASGAITVVSLIMAYVTRDLPHG